MGNSSGNVDIVTCLHRQIIGQVIAKPHLGLAAENVDRGLVILVQVGVSSRARRDGHHVHADTSCAYGFRGDSSKVVETLLPMKCWPTGDYPARKLRPGRTHGHCSGLLWATTPMAACWHYSHSRPAEQLRWTHSLGVTPARGRRPSSRSSSRPRSC